MKKITLVLTVLLFTGLTFAQEGGKSCCKKGGKCSKECSKKDKKADSKDAESSKSSDKKSAKPNSWF